jgi:hypothetical protein
MLSDTPAIEQTHFMNWLQNNHPALYSEYWRIIGLANNNTSLELNPVVKNLPLVKRLQQATVEYLAWLGCN